MFFRIIIFLFLALNAVAVTAQDPKRDTAAVAMDDDLDWDDLEDILSDLERFLDSLMRPRSYTVISFSVYPAFYNYKGTAATRIESVSQTAYSPFAAYYHKSGLGLSASGFLTDDREKLNFYQFSLSPSFDYLRDTRLATGVAYTRYFPKDSLSFYVSPLTNELSGYFTWRKSWLRPTLLVNYAWGSREELNMRLAFVERLWLRRRLLNWLQENYEKNISDVSVTVSALHDFYWLQVLSKKDNIRITPQLAFTAGTQRYGFNQRINNYLLNKTTRADLLSTARELNLDGSREFQPLSVSFTLRTEYSIGKFFIQPQLLLDYYIPSEEKPLSTFFLLNAGFNF